MPPIGKKKVDEGTPGNGAVKAPKLTNRGGAGLYGKLSDAQKAGLKQVEVPTPILGDPKTLHGCAAKDRITPALQGMEVDINLYQLDPNNARVHGDRNMDAIISALYLYGQMKPIVVRAQTGIIVAGNGTISAARALGWETIAANVVEMTDAEAIGYGLADNRTAELAKWDFEVVARLDRILVESGHPPIGWSNDELEVLRAAEWTPPPVDESFNSGSGGQGVAGDPAGGSGLLVSFTPNQYEVVGWCINQMREQLHDPEMIPDRAIELICEEWLKMRGENIALNQLAEDNQTPLEGEPDDATSREEQIYEQGDRATIYTPAGRAVRVSQRRHNPK